MAARALTANERAVLAHVAVDPDAWWDHANSVEKIDAEKALAEKVAKWQPSYDLAKPGPDYKPRAERTGQSPALPS